MVAGRARHTLFLVEASEHIDPIYPSQKNLNAAFAFDPRNLRVNEATECIGMSVRKKVLVELGIVAVLTTTFLSLFPVRTLPLDLALAGFALTGVILSTRYTKNVIWAASAPPVAENRVKRGWITTLWITLPTAILFLIAGGIATYPHGGLPAVSERELNWRVLASFGGYLPWALIQQTLLQFYLLGRLAVLFPRQLRLVPLMATGLCFGLVHLPDIRMALVTVAAGTVWSFLYFRYRLLLPLAFSHAALGTTFYYGIMGHDLAAEAKALVH